MKVTHRLSASPPITIEGTERITITVGDFEVDIRPDENGGIRITLDGIGDSLCVEPHATNAVTLFELRR